MSFRLLDVKYNNYRIQSMFQHIPCTCRSSIILKTVRKNKKVSDKSRGYGQGLLARHLLTVTKYQYDATKNQQNKLDNLKQKNKQTNSLYLYRIYIYTVIPYCNIQMKLYIYLQNHSSSNKICLDSEVVCQSCCYKKVPCKHAPDLQENANAKV